MAIQIGDRVCRRSARKKIVGTVRGVWQTTASVEWDRTLTGTTRIGGGAEINTTVKLTELCHESEFTARPISGPAESDWRTVAFRVDCDHTSGERVSEYGDNAFWVGTEGEAVEKARELLAAGRTNVRVSKQEEAKWVPAGCRAERSKYRWSTAAVTVEA
jgi:hypothetical protein